MPIEVIGESSFIFCLVPSTVIPNLIGNLVNHRANKKTVLFKTMLVLYRRFLNEKEFNDETTIRLHH
jgi:hypothetical protein